MRHRIGPVVCVIASSAMLGHAIALKDWGWVAGHSAFVLYFVAVLLGRAYFYQPVSEEK